MLKLRRFFLIGFFVSAHFQIPLPAFAENPAPQAQPANELFDLSIDQLINLEVTSASKKTERIADAASAIYVLTSEDIRRSGATSIPELLRLVPGLDVARIDSSQYAISSRGFNGLFADKLLVLIDGRTIYTPLFGGVFWNEHDTMLEDIDRIEVIRGPGATLYGANAVNGVINIITKGAESTKGSVVAVGGGTEERGFAEARTGDKVGNLNYRLYAKGLERDSQTLESTGDDAADRFKSARTGFRTDTIKDNQRLTVQGDYYYGEAGWNPIIPTVTGIPDLNKRNRFQNGGNLLSRWTETYADNSDLMLQMYYDYVYRDDRVLEQQRHTFDFDSEYHFSPLSGHDVVSGFGYRFFQDDMTNSFSVSLDPSSREQNLITGFIQDEISLIPDHLKLVVGTKLERNDLSGFEVQPNVRLIATPNERNSIWTAVSRAVRSPARFNHDGRLVLGVLPGGSNPDDQGLPTEITLNGRHGYDSEVLVAYEAGYRAQINQGLSFDVVGFYNNYDKLESDEPAGAPFVTSYQGSPLIEVPLAIYNKVEGFADGIELVADWKPTSWWRLIGTYSFLNLQVHRNADSQATIYTRAKDESSRNQFGLRSLVNLPMDFEFDTSIRYLSPVDQFNIDGYFEGDVRLAWKASKRVELSVVGQNLFHKEHIEFASNLVDTQRIESQRGVYGKALVRF